MDKQLGISMEVCSSFEGLDIIRSHWDSLVEEMASSIFQTYDWCRIWWKHYGQGRKLFILLFRRNDQLIGILPLFAEKIWLGPVPLNIIKILNCDYTYSTSWPAIQEPYVREVFKLAFERLPSLFCWDVFLLDSLPGIFDAQAERLIQSIKEILSASFGINEGKAEEQTYFTLPKTYDQYIQSLSKKTQHELRRKRKLFDEVADSEGCLNSRIGTKEEVADIFNAFYCAHQKHWQQQNRSGHFGDWPHSREFHSELAQTMSELGRLRLLEVRCGTEPIGYKYAYRFGKILVEFLDARIDKPSFGRASIGNLIFLEQVKWACDEGVEIIDSLTGRFEHKLQMGGKLLPSRSLLIYRKSSCIRLIFFQWLAGLLNFIYYKLWFCRICPRYNLRRGLLWKSWIRSHALAMQK
jgi:CelD/BcsL family acetyltransferase involved in cellulose biosynthesis